ncbi:MAG: hypothetical protein Fur0037_11300 [Planctomycetota bacterium]
MVDDALGNILPAGERHGRSSPRFGEPAGCREVPAEHPPPSDSVDLSAGGDALFRLLRGRVLALTKEELGLPEDAPVPSFADVGSSSPHGFLGRLLSEQNLLASCRAGQWSPGEIRAALAEGFRRGATETLELLAAASRLDEASQEFVSSLLADFAERCSPPAGPEP